MNKDQKLLQEAYQSIYESAISFHDDRLTEKEERFVDQAVDAMIEQYPSSLKNYLDIYKEISKSIFGDTGGQSTWVAYISIIREIMGNERSNFNQMHKAGLIVLDDERSKDNLKEDFKMQVARNISDRFKNNLPLSFTSLSSGRAYVEQRAKEVRDKRIQKRVDKELDKSFDLDVLKDF